MQAFEDAVRAQKQFDPGDYDDDYFIVTGATGTTLRLDSRRQSRPATRS